MKNFTQIIEKPISAANAAIKLSERTHSALANVLVAILPALSEIRGHSEEFSSYAEREFGLRVTGQSVDATCLLLIKVVFNGTSAEHDFRRSYNHWCLALLHLEQQRLEPCHALQYIRDNGGINGCVKAWRAGNTLSVEEKMAGSRRVEQYVNGIPKIGTTNIMAGGEMVTTINTPKDQRTLEALAQQPGRVLMLGEIDGDMNLKIIGIVERDAKKVLNFLSTRARADTAPCEPSNSNFTNIDSQEAM